MTAHAPLAFVDEGLGNSSYLIDVGDGRAVVVDPSRHPGQYLAEAERRGLQVAFTVETHLHSDFVSGSRELAALGATVVAPAAAALDFPARGLGDGESLDLGGLALRGLATPGHTPEHLSYVVEDAGRPVALFSGGSLLVGAVARTDLIAPDQTEPLARELWRSLRERILSLPDDLPVYPTHGAGSFCSAPAGGERTTTIGAEKRTNPLLAAPDEDAFVKLLLGGLGSYPPYFLRLRDVNRCGPIVFGAGEPQLPGLEADDVRSRIAAGATVVDTRAVAAFAAGHIAGSLSIPFRDVFATWLGWLVPAETPIVFVVDDTTAAAHAAVEARKVGYEQLEGVVAGGVDTWLEPLVRISLEAAGGASGTVVDVRQRHEYDAGHIPGALHVELGDVGHATVPDGPVSFMCGHGERAMSAASILERAGHRDVTVLTGGPDDWARTRGESLATS
ncbi:MAG TPA: MBL fold metallo-hydrolase [Acidimicrobiales bacterium]|nr:MBL fold metallo-hydrolase [Acidimicrobiales bacterium]